MSCASNAFTPSAKSTFSSVALTAALAGAALPATTADAGYVDNTSWTINVSADPIGCPGTATVTANFTFRKGPAGGPLTAGSLDVHLFDADGDGLFGSGDDLIGKHTVTWVQQVGNTVNLTVTFDVECEQTEDGWCTIKGNAGTDDEGDPHEMYIYVVEPNSGALWNNSWTSPKDQGNWIKYSFPLRCGCDENAGRPVEYDISFEPTGQSVTTVSFDLPEAGPTSPPLEFFETVLLFDTDRLNPQEIAIIGDGGRVGDVFGELQVQPVPGGLVVGAPVIDPEAAQQMQQFELELLMQQADPMDFGMVRIHHDPQQTVAFFGDGSNAFFQPVDGEIPLRPFDIFPPQMDPELLVIDPQSQPGQFSGQPVFVVDDLDPFFFGQRLDGQIELELRVLDLQEQVIFETTKPANPDGSFDVDMGGDLLPPGGFLQVFATDAAGNTAQLFAPFGGCNPADLVPPYGVLDLSDVSAFIDAFTGQQGLGDLNGDGVFDLNDISAFIDAFQDGCP